MPAYARMLGDEYDKDMSRGQIAEALRSGEAMPKVSFMLAVVLLETGAKNRRRQFADCLCPQN